jgi:tRNA pseudouridine38-40 synthase
VTPELGGSEQSPGLEGGAVQRYRATVEYDGTDFHGFQRQAQGERTVQETLEAALWAVAGQAVTVMGAGRTDAGVHARGQVIGFDVDWRHGEAALGRAMNANLTGEVAVQEVERVERRFHPRFSAWRRTYQYTVCSQLCRSPLLRRTTWHRRRPLLMTALNAAGGLLLGEHDFATFGKPPTGENTVRRVFRAEWRRNGGLVVFSIEANAFLNRMVRSLVGTMCQVGAGEWSVERFAAAFAAADRAQAGPTAPPQGLCLLSVGYP